MTAPDTCPVWCAEDHEMTSLHASANVYLEIGRGDPAARPPGMRVSAVLSRYGDTGPMVSVHPLLSAGGSLWVTPKNAEALAGIIDRLASATPAQHRKVAAAIRQAAALITGGSGS